MAILKIDNFGGEMPSVSARALPPSAARTSTNLYLGTNEFRPARTDATVQAITAGVLSMHKMEQTGEWVLSTDYRSYVKGQINGDVDERTYFTVDDGSEAPKVITASNTVAPRILGVPVPDKPAVVHNVTDEVTDEEAPDYIYGEFTEAVFAALSTSVIDASNTTLDASRQLDATNTTIGPYSLYGLLWSDNAVLQNRYLGNPYYLVALFPWADAEQMNLLLGEMDGAAIGYDPATGSPVYAAIPILALPFVYRIDETSLRNKLADIQYPSGFGALSGTPALSADHIDSLVEFAQKWFAPDSYASALRTKLDQAVSGFAQLIVDHPDGSQAAVLSLLDTAATVTHSINLVTVDRYKRFLEDNLLTKAWIESQGGSTGIVGDVVQRLVETRFYVTTFVTDWGEESAPSEPSDQIDLDQNDSVTLTLGTVPAGRNITQWRIYRSNTGSQSTEFLYVGEVDIATETYQDAIAGEALGEACPSLTWLAPPQASAGSAPYLRGLTGMPNGIMAGFFERTVAFCEPYVPYAWPVGYQITTEYPIVGLGVFGQTLFVGTTGNPYFISGADSASMSAQKLDTPQACASRQSIVSVQGGVLYASPDGLCVADPTGVKVVTAAMYTREDWQALAPESMFATSHDKLYYLWYSGNGGGCLVFDLASQKLGHLDLTATAAESDKLTDTLYVADGTSLKGVFTGTAHRTAVWKSGVAVLPAQAAFAWVKVYGEQTIDSPVIVRWYGDGALVYTATITDIQPQRLPAGRWLEHQLEIESAARITRVMVTGTTQELQSV